METAEVQDMVSKIREFSQFVSDTLVNASTLAETVKQVQAELAEARSSFEGRIAQMQGELDHLRNLNNDLTENINHIRQERDNAQEEVGHLRTEVANATRQQDEANSELAVAREQISRLQGELASTKSAHDDAEFRALHWEEQHGKVKGDLDKVRAALGVGSPDALAEPHPVERTGTGW